MKFFEVVVTVETATKNGVEKKTKAASNRKRGIGESSKPDIAWTTEGYEEEKQLLGQIAQSSGLIDFNTIFALKVNDPEIEVTELKPAIGGPPKDQQSDFYHNCTTPKGQALLICNYSFSDSTHVKTRPGSNIDYQNMKKLLQLLGYKVTSWKNSKAT